MPDKTGRAALAPTRAARNNKNISKHKSTRTGPYVNSRVRALREKLVAATWAGPMNARAVLLALLDIGTEIAPYVYSGIPAVPGDDSTHPDYDITIGAPVRRLTELAGMSRNAVSAALRWLEDNRYIYRAKEFGGCHRSTKWQLGPATRAHLSNFRTDNINDSILSVPKLDTSGGVWDSALLGRNAERIYIALSGEPATISAIARAAGMKWDTARKHLDALRAVDLATVTETGWTPLSSGSADLKRRVPDEEWMAVRNMTPFFPKRWTSSRSATASLPRFCSANSVLVTPVLPGSSTSSWKRGTSSDAMIEESIS